MFEEKGNRKEYFAVAVYKDFNIVGHVLRSNSNLCSIFSRCGGGNHQYSHDLPQGGLKVQCGIYFTGSGQEFKKVWCYFINAKSLPFVRKGNSTYHQKN